MKCIRITILLCLVTAFQPPLGSQARATETIRLATLEWEPYIGDPPTGRGYVAELVRHAYATSGYEVTLIFLPWARVVATAKNGDVDGYLPEYYSHRLEADFLLSDPFPGGPLGLFKRREDAIIFVSLEDLRPYVIGTVRGYVNTEPFDNADYLQKEAVTNDRLNFLKLVNRRIDLVVADKFVGYHILRTRLPEHVEAIEFINPPLEEKVLHLCIARSTSRARIKLEAFNAGLRILQENGWLRRLRQDQGFDE